MVAILLAVIMSSSTRPHTPVVDVIEINHYMDESGEKRFTQVIAWEWLPDYRRHRVQDWKICDEWQALDGVLTFLAAGKHYTVRYKIFRETYTTHDPERVDKQLFPEKNRIKVFLGR